MTLVVSMTIPFDPSHLSTKSGLEFILQLCVEDDERAGTLLAVSNKCAYIPSKYIRISPANRYYALSAACALFKYTETKLNTRFAAASLRIQYVPVEGTMMVDPDTARNLELVGNMSYKKSTHSLFGRVPFCSSLEGVSSSRNIGR